MTLNLNVKWCKLKMLIYNEDELLTCINISGLKTKEEIRSKLKKNKKLIDFNNNISNNNINKIDTSGIGTIVHGDIVDANRVCGRNRWRQGKCLEYYDPWWWPFSPSCIKREYRCL